MTTSIQTRFFDEIQIGEEAHQTIKISTEMVDQFIELSGDISPIHIDDEAARERGFDGRVVHGLLTTSLVSKVFGTILPGTNGLLHDIAFSFKQPIYINDTLHIKVEVIEKHESFKLVFLKVYIRNQHDVIVCRGKVQSGLAN